MGMPIDFSHGYPHNRRMTADEIVSFFGPTQAAAAKKLGCNQSTISDWVRAGFVPSDWQLYIERTSGGALRVDAEDIVRRVVLRIRRRRDFPEAA